MSNYERPDLRILYGVFQQISADQICEVAFFMGAIDQWYGDESELVFTECVVLIVMIIVALFFEYVHHAVQHEISPVLSHAASSLEYQYVHSNIIQFS
jgi:hypothetical protein